MTEKQINIMRLALLKMGKFLRQNPPGFEATGEAGIPMEEYIVLLAGGANRDPEGLEFVYYFLREAEKDLEKLEGDK